MIISSQIAPTAKFILPLPAEEVSTVPVYQTVEVIVPRALLKALAKMTHLPLANEVAQLLRIEGDNLPLIAVVAVEGGQVNPLRMQSVRTEDMLLLGQPEYHEWKNGRPEAFLNLLRSALSKPSAFVKVGFNTL